MSILVIAAIVPGCFTPAAIQASDRRKLALEDFPPGTELVRVPVEPDTSLRGVFVPSEAGAPVVVHFLESGCSVPQGSCDFPSHAYVLKLTTANSFRQAVRLLLKAALVPERAVEARGGQWIEVYEGNAWRSLGLAE